MTTKIKIYIAIAGAAFLIIAGHSLWSGIQIRRLESVSNEAKAIAADHEKHADELEKAWRKYEEKSLISKRI
jgi:hypothetical protein